MWNLCKTCPFEAIEMDGKLPRINYEKCVQCMLCVENITKIYLGLDNRVKVEKK